MRRALLAAVAGFAFLPGWGQVRPWELARAPATGARPNDLVARGTRGAVASAEPQATRIGLEVLQRGGNAIDAAVATFLALAVTHPQAGNLGGGGFFLIRTHDGACTAIDFRERAPRRASAEMYQKPDGSVDADKSRNGALAAGVPGSPAGLLLALRRVGTRPLPELAAPAIALARDGFVVDGFLARDLAENARDLGRYPSTRAVFFTGERPLRAGERLVQKDLAATLTRFAEQGFDGFYRGETGRRIVAQMERDGGLIEAADLAGYEAKEREPLRGTYRGLEVLSMPPPSSGGVALLQMLNLLEPYDLAGSGFGGSKTIHLLTEAMRRAYADRARWLGDPDFVTVPVAGLIGKEYAQRLRAGLRTDAVSEVAPGRPPGAPESDDTTHLSVVDPQGNAVACTTTINSTFGGNLVVEGAGFLLNNEMDDFSAKPGVPNQFGLIALGSRSANEIAPGKRMLSSMTPTIVLADCKLRLVLGSPGGGRIITTVLQVILNVADHGMPIEAAVAAPRVHHQWTPEQLAWERTALSPDVRQALSALGHQFAREPTSLGQCMAIEARGGSLTAVADPRSGGAAGAW